MPDLVERLQELFDDLDEEPSDEEVADALQDVRQGAYQTIFDAGHSDATGRHRDRIDELEGDLEEAREDLQEAQDRIDELEGENPEVSEIRSQYEEQLDETRQEAQDRIEGLEGTLREEREARFRSDLVARLTAKHGLDSDYAEIQVERALSNGRVEFDEDGSAQVLQDGKDIPIQADDPKGALAEEIESEADPKWKVSNADSGSGTESGSGGGGGSSNRFERIREEREEELEEDEGAGW